MPKSRRSALRSLDWRLVTGMAVAARAVRGGRGAYRSLHVRRGFAQHGRAARSARDGRGVRAISNGRALDRDAGGVRSRTRSLRCSSREPPWAQRVPVVRRSPDARPRPVGPGRVYDDGPRNCLAGRMGAAPRPALRAIFCRAPLFRRCWSMAVEPARSSITNMGLFPHWTPVRDERESDRQPCGAAQSRGTRFPGPGSRGSCRVPVCALDVVAHDERRRVACAPRCRIARRTGWGSTGTSP